jgi:hypothetical protein
MRMSWWGCRVFAGAFAALARRRRLATKPPPCRGARRDAAGGGARPGDAGDRGRNRHPRLVKEGGAWVYVISFFDEDGARRELKVNAVTAAILGINARPK